MGDLEDSIGKIPLWLDCDPGHDDAFAILLAAHHPALSLLGISTVHGNASTDDTTTNAGAILTAIGAPAIPVYRGARTPLLRPAVHADAIHGATGLEGTTLLPVPAVPPRDGLAIDAMAQALFAEAPHTPWLVATGTLTNVALLFAKFPSLAEHIAGLSIMGGAIGGGFTSAPMGKVGESERFGNWTPWGEFNVVVDPEAAAQIFSNPVLNTKITLAPLDLTHQVLCTPEVVQLLKYGRHGKPPSKLRTMLVELVTYFAATYSSVFGLPSPPLHDPLAVAAILTSLPASHPSAIPFYDRPPSAPSTAHERFAVTVVTDGTAEEAMAGLTQTGRTIATLLPGGEPGVRIPRGLDVGRFWEVLEECLERAEGVSPLGS